MWGVPTYGNEKVPCTITIIPVCAKLGQLMKSSKGKNKRQKADIISSISFFQKEKQDSVKLHSIACSHLERRGNCYVANFCTYANLPYSRAHGQMTHPLFGI
jgi:imidazole glycerol phosphate synthase subunit HisF